MSAVRWLLRRVISDQAAAAIEGDLLEADSGAPRGLGAEMRRTTHLLRITAALWRENRRARRGGLQRWLRGPSRDPLLDPSGGESPRERIGLFLIQDLRFAMRLLLARPTFTAMAVVSLALGIGANTAIFSILDAVLLRPLPVPQPERLVSTGTAVISYPDYLDFRDRSSDVFEELAAWETTSSQKSLRGPNGVELVSAQLVTGNYFAALGAVPLLGRTLTPEDDDLARATAVISGRLWRRSFAADPGVVGTEIAVNGVPATIVGVAGADFVGHRLNRLIDLWMPLQLHPVLATGSRTRMRLEDRRVQWIRSMGRLREGVSAEQARASLNATVVALIEEYPSTYLTEFKELVPATRWAVPRRDEVQSFLRLLTGMVGFALLVACANVANLMLGRAVERRLEIGVRMALGAPRHRLLRQLLVESSVLSLLGGAVGLLFAYWTVGAIGALQLPGRITLRELELGLDPVVLGFTFAVAVATGILFGLAPALAATRPDPATVISNSAGRSTGSTRLPDVLIAAQVALTLALLVGGGLFARSLRTALDVDLGFDPSGIAVASIDLGVAGYDEAGSSAFYRQALPAIVSVPEVESAAWAVYIPVASGSSMESFLLQGMAIDEINDVSLNHVSQGYFETLRQPIVQGRPFRASDDEGTPGVVIVNETMASTFWPDGKALGSRILMPGENGPATLEVVGVAADTKILRLREEPRPYLYRPLQQWTWLIGANRMRLAARTTGPPQAALASLRLTLQRLDPNLPISNLRPLDAQLYDLIMPQRVGAFLLGLFALLALALAGVGIYGVVANAVTQRVREIGIRRALGATGPEVVRLLLTKGLLPVALGLPVGVLLAVSGTGLIASFLPGLSPTDPLTFAGTAALLLGVALLACYLPARRAARLDPARALREQ